MRHRHPFVTCTHCGPRFTIATDMPYDRAVTTMAGFPMCADCGREYGDPGDRRFHAQPVACPDCGPRLRLVPADGSGVRPARDADALAAARALLTAGRIVAVKGLGGYHLACDATDARAVETLRTRKARGGKPFAVMCADLGAVRRIADPSAAELAALTSARRPIVLLRRRAEQAGLAPGVCPGSPHLGVMLPYTPVHTLLFGLPGDPPGSRVLVMTSGNRSGEPIVTDDDEALTRLAGLADAWLAHDRPVSSPCDDSLLRVRPDGTEQVLRRSRGYVPRPLRLPVPVRPTLAVGGDLKNALCLGEGDHAWFGPHIGDMGDLATLEAARRAEAHMRSLTGVDPELVAADRHPGYHSARWARRRAHRLAPVFVQHHHAHIASAMAQHGLDGTAPVIGVAFDGTGYGDDGTVWGGEILLADYTGYRRFAHLAPAPLPGGDAGVANPCRLALARLWAAGLAWDADLPSVTACAAGELAVVKQQLTRGVACVATSSMGPALRRRVVPGGRVPSRGVRGPGRPGAGGRRRFGLGRGHLGLRLRLHRRYVRPGTRAERTRRRSAARHPGPPARRSLPPCGGEGRRGDLAGVRDQDTGLAAVALSGGVFANALLEEECARLLSEDSFAVLRHGEVPPNDGGLALGQLVVAAHLRQEE